MAKVPDWSSSNRMAPPADRRRGIGNADDPPPPAWPAEATADRTAHAAARESDIEPILRKAGQKHPAERPYSGRPAIASQGAAAPTARPA